MGTNQRRRDPRGKCLYADRRNAASPGANGDQISVNVTSFGRDLHGISPGEELDVHVHENGIWIEAGDDE